MLIQSDKLLAVPHANHRHSNPPATGLNAEVMAIVMKDLSFALSEAAELLHHTAVENNGAAEKMEQGINFYREVDYFKIGLIRSALAHTHGKQKSAAKLLGIRLSTLNAMIKRFGIGARAIAVSKKM
jgi:transcriptional regulator with GAF, ATPase, and Fis domain